MRDCGNGVILLTALAFLVVGAAGEARDEKERQTYVVRYKNGEQTIPVTVVLDYHKQIEYVINMNSRTPAKSVTLYDFKQRTIAYKDLSNGECFLGRLTHETINNESYALQLLKNPVDSKPEVLSLDAKRPALTPTEIKNIAGQKTAVFCRKMSTWLLTPLKTHRRKKRAVEHGESTYGHHGYQTNSHRSLQHRRIRNSNHKSSVHRLPRDKTITRNRDLTRSDIEDVNSNTSPTSEFIFVPRRRKFHSESSGHGAKSFLRHQRYDQRERDEHSQSQLARASDERDERHSDVRTEFLFNERDAGVKEKNGNSHRITESQSSFDFRENNLVSRNSRGDLDYSTQLSTDDESGNRIPDETHRNSSLLNSNNFGNTFQSLSDDRNQSASDFYSASPNNRDFDHNTPLINTKKKEDNGQGYPVAYDISSLYKPEVHEVEFDLAQNIRESEEHDNYEPPFGADSHAHKDTVSHSVHPEENHPSELIDSAFERLIDSTSTPKLERFGHEVPKEKSEENTETANSNFSVSYERNSPDAVQGQNVVENYPILKNDYYATSYVLPNSRPESFRNEPIDERETLELNNDLSLKSRQENLTAIHKKPNKSLYSEGTIDYTPFAPIATENSNEYAHTDIPLPHEDRKNTNSRYQFVNFPAHSNAQRDNSANQLASQLTTDHPIVNRNNYIASHRLDTPSEDDQEDLPTNFQAPTDVKRQWNYGLGPSPIPNVTINEGFPPHQVRIQNVLRLFTPDEIIIDIEKLPTVETPNSGFHQRTSFRTQIPTRKSQTTNRVSSNRNEQKSGRIGRIDISPTTRRPVQHHRVAVQVPKQPSPGITFHVRQNTRLHPQPNALPPGVSMHPRHPQAPFADLARHNMLPPFLPENIHPGNNHVLKPHRQRHHRRKDRYANSCCRQQQQGRSSSSCCRDKNSLGRRHRNDRMPRPTEITVNGNGDSRHQLTAIPSGDSPRVEDAMDRCQREKMCRTLYQSTQQVLVCRKAEIEGC